MGKKKKKIIESKKVTKCKVCGDKMVLGPYGKAYQKRKFKSLSPLCDFCYAILIPVVTVGDNPEDYW